jgi:hypothetical protein
MSDYNFKMPSFDLPQSFAPQMPDLTKFKSVHEANYASEFYTRLSEYVIDFESSINPDEEVAIKLVCYGEAITIQVNNLGYYNPSLITFEGINVLTGDRVQLIQHISQINFLLVAIKTNNPKPEMERVGFKLKHQLEKMREG